MIKINFVSHLSTSHRGFAGAFYFCHGALIVFFLIAGPFYLSAQPSPVTNLNATRGQSEGGVVLGWMYPGPSSLPVGSTYFIQHSQDSDVVWSTASAQIRISTSNVNSGAPQSHTITGLTGGATYFFRIWTSSPPANFSPISNAATSWAQRDLLPPGQITNLSATLSAQILLTWTAPGDDVYNGSVVGGGFLIRYSTNPSDTPQTATYQISISSNFSPATSHVFMLTSLLPSATHYIWISAFDENSNQSNWSSTATAVSSSFFLSQTFEGLRDVLSSENGFSFSDIDTDGYIDLAVSGFDGVSRKNVIYRNSVGNFSLWQEFPVGLQASSLYFGDINSDGKDDKIAVGSPDGSTRRFFVYRNTSGTPPFVLDSEPMGSADGFVMGCVVLMDFDNDGDNDIVVSGIGPGSLPNNRYLRVYENNNSSFTMRFDLTGLSNSALSVGDYNKDGWVDLAAIGRDTTGNRRFILFRNSSGTFLIDQEPLGVNIGLENGSVAFCDYDLDGDLDIAVSGTIDGTASGRRLILFKNTNGVFSLDQEPMGLAAGVDNSSLAFGDYNTDGWPDIVVTGRDNNGLLRFILFKNSSGTFYSDQEILGQNLGLQLSSVVFGDIDNDGDLDLVVSGSPSSGISNLIRIYKNTYRDSGKINAAPSAPPGPIAEYIDENLVISFQDGSDDKTPQQSLNYLVRMATAPFSINPSSYVVSPQWATPFSGNYPRPKRIGTTNSILIKKLAIRTTYYFSVASIDSGLLKSVWSDENSHYIADIYPPRAVTSIVAVTGASEGEIKLSWIAPGDIPQNKKVSEYIIKYATFSINSLLGDTTAWWSVATSLNNTPSPQSPGSEEITGISGLFPSSTYYFSIKSKDADGNISPIDEPTVSLTQAFSYALDIVPAPPTGLKSVASSGLVELFWNDMLGQLGYLDFDYYEIHRSTDGNTYSLIGTTRSNTYVDTSVTNGTTYFYKMNSYDAPPQIFISAFSSVVSTRPIGVPSAPSEFSGMVLSTGSILWSWKDNSPDEDGFRIFSSTNALLSELPHGTTIWLETNFSANTNYSRYVAAYNSVSISSSNVASRYTMAMPPVDSYVLKRTSHSIEITWSNNGNPASTRWGVLRSTNNFFTSTFTLSSFANNQTGTTFTDSAGLEPATTYYYKVQAFNSEGIPTIYDTTISTITLPAIPSEPLGFRGVAVSTVAINWTWEITSSATYYQIYRAGDNHLLKNLEGNETISWNEIGLEPNTQYSRYIKAGNASGVSFGSSVVSKYTLANPPGNLGSIAKTKNSITLSWQSPTGGSSKFRLERSLDGLFFSVVSDNISGSSSTYTDGNLSHSTTYYYRLYGFNGDGIITAPTDIVNVMTDKVVDKMPPLAPTGVRGSFSGGIFQIFWDEVKYNEDLSPIYDIDGYLVYRSTSMDGIYEKITMLPLKSNEFSQDTKKNVYYYTIKAVDIYSNESLPSAIVASKTAPVIIVMSDNKDLFVETSAILPENSVLRITEVPEEKIGRVVKSFVVALRDIKSNKEKNVPKEQTFNISFTYFDRGSAVMSPGSYESEYAVYWFNGVRWIRFGGAVDRFNKTISVAASVLGKFQLKLTNRSTFSVGKDDVYPKIITPNGDNKNDFLIINFDGPPGIEERVVGFIFDKMGRFVKKLNKRGPNRETSLRWDGDDEFGNKVPSGIYIYQIESDDKVINGTVTVSR